ncbi:hypothetical protein [Maribacter confluentis]|uniref:hypothetical protein n=1 Tax=Maribacter confluentis TaxID=1656093 RepID=UPI00345BF889
MSQFQIGDIVETIDDVIKGRVNAINGKDITIISDDGFPLVYEPHELVLMANDIRVSNFDIARIKKEKEIPKRKKIYHC